MRVLSMILSIGKNGNVGLVELGLCRVQVLLVMAPEAE